MKEQSNKNLRRQNPTKINEMNMKPSLCVSFLTFKTFNVFGIFLPYGIRFALSTAVRSPWCQLGFSEIETGLHKGWCFAGVLFHFFIMQKCKQKK